MARPPRMQLAALISIATLAQMWGVRRNSALDRLKRIDAAAGGGVLLRIGRGPRSPVFTTTALLRAAEPGLVEEAQIDREDLTALREEVRRLRADLTIAKRRVRELITAFRPAADE